MDVATKEVVKPATKNDVRMKEYGTKSVRRVCTF